MFAAIKRKVYEQIRAEGYAEGYAEVLAEVRQQAHAEWDAWLRRRTATGVFVPDDADPPPYRSAD